jgi:hypothetical protein
MSEANRLSVISRVSRCECLGDVVQQVGVAELANGDVDADVHAGRIVGVLPGGGLLGGLPKNPAADGDDESARFGERDEVQRWYQATVGMLPAQERLVALDAAGAQVDDRLVVQQELFRVEGVFEVGLQSLAVELGGVVVGLEGLVPAFAGRLGDG